MLGQKLKHGISCLAIAATVVFLAGCGASRSKDAALFYEQKEYEKALSVYQEIESTDPKAITKDKKTAELYKGTKTEVAKLYHARALEAADQMDLGRAVSILRDAEGLDPDNTDVKSALESAQDPAPDKAMSEKNWREAIASLDGAVQSESNNILARARKAEAEAEKDKGEALFADGMKEFDAGRFSASLGILEQCKAQDPFHPRIEKALEDANMKVAGARALFEKAEKHFSLKDWASAIGSYDMTLQADPSYPAAAGRKAEAEGELKKADALFSEGLVKSGEKKYSSALSLFTQCREQNPKHPEAAKAVKTTSEKLAAIEKQYKDAQAAIARQEFEKGISSLEQLLLEVYPYHEGAVVSAADALSKVSSGLEEKSALGAAMLTIHKARLFTAKFTSEDGGVAPEVSKAIERLGSHMGRLSNKAYRRTEYEFSVIAKDAMSASAREEMLSQAAARAVTGRPANLKMSAKEFTRLSAPERNADILGEAAKAPNRFVLLIEITAADVLDDRSDIPLQKEYISHYVTEYNPAYSQAKSNYEMEAQSYQSAKEQHRRESEERSRQMTQQGGLFGAVMGGLASGLTEPSRSSLNQAEQTLAQTPQTIQKPVSAMHYYSEVTITRKAMVDVYARLAGQGVELAENWQEQEVFSEKYFENPKPEIDIPRITVRPPQDRKLVEDAFMRLGPKVAGSLLEVKKHLIGRYALEGDERAAAKSLLMAYESYINAFFIDPAIASERILGQPAVQPQQADAGLPFDLGGLSMKLQPEAQEGRPSAWVSLLMAGKADAEKPAAEKAKAGKKKK